ncbi:uncharacterized protein LOC126171192 [Schistocerca cancellata]|uniref:uncharacterized protein LOC126171192 n=1 Tax=Schistocerca cancellata TaxID=274614 RepID=UPI0021190C54|nr:uncharacterized protein LOC126171192 [Schistocerca cancellata]
MVFQSDFMDNEYEAHSIQLDEETGEHVEPIQFTFVEGLATTNEETGEPEAFRLKETAEERVCSGGRRKKPFQIPRSALLQDEDEPDVKRSGPLVPAAPSVPTGIVLKRQKSCIIEEHVGRASQNMNPAVFLLPTLFLFPAWASIFCIILELCIHMWAHRKNWERSELVGAGTSPLPALYRSPLNTITSEFCAYCQSDKLMATIGKLQDERKTRLDNRKLRYCAYVERMSVVT